jgi:glycosyl transferase family 25
MIYEDMLQQGYHRILIFEDDALPDARRLPAIPWVLDELPPDWELLLWGWDKNGERNWRTSFKQALYHVQHALGRINWTHQLISRLYARPFSVQLKKAGFHDYTYAYAVSAAGAKKLAQMQAPIQYIADNLLAHAGAGGLLNAYIAWPAVFLHDSPLDGTKPDSYIR